MRRSRKDTVAFQEQQASAEQSGVDKQLLGEAQRDVSKSRIFTTLCTQAEAVFCGGEQADDICSKVERAPVRDLPIANLHHLDDEVIEEIKYRQGFSTLHRTVS